MKITYIIEVDPSVHSGIIKKIDNQIALWEKKGHEVQSLILWPGAQKKTAKYLEGRYFSNFLLDRLPQGFLNTYLTKITSISRVGNALKSFKPDLVYIRQNIWYPGLSQVLRKYKTVMELNTVDYLEMEYYSSLKKKVYLWGKDRLLNAVSALVAVSPSILEHYKTYPVPQEVVANGIDLSKFQPKTLVDTNNPPRLIFVGSANMYWHGLDKILSLAEKLPEYDFDIVGYATTDISHSLPGNVTVHGWLNSDQLMELYQKCTIGLGSFGNHYVGKPVDSTLKVLEYLANGLPVIMGHRDVDFHNVDFVLKATDETHELIPVNKIKSFIEANKNRRVDHSQIAQVDSSVKEQERLDFFKTIVQSNSN